MQVLVGMSAINRETWEATLSEKWVICKEVLFEIETTD